MRILSTVFFLSLLAGKLTAFEHIFTYRINRQNLRLPYEKHLFLSFRREKSTVPGPNHIFFGQVQQNREITFGLVASSPLFWRIICSIQGRNVLHLFFTSN